jgi:hypothetical protein
VLVETPPTSSARCATDLYLRKWAVPGAGRPALTRAEFGALGLDVVKDRATVLVPPEADTGRGLPHEHRAAGAR